MKHTAVYLGTTIVVLVVIYYFPHLEKAFVASLVGLLMADTWEKD